MQRPFSVRAVCVRLFAAQLLLGFGIVALVTTAVVGVTDEWQTAGLLGATLGLSALIGLWSGLSKTAISKRVVGAVIGGPVLCATLAATNGAVHPDSLEAEWILAAVFSMVPLLAIGIFAATLKWRGFEVERLDLDERACGRRGVQFSLAYLFAITSLAAVLFAAIRGLRGLPSRPWELFCLIAAFNAVLFVLHTQVCLWAALGAGRLVLRMGAAIASTALAAGVYGFALDRDKDGYQICIEMMVIYSTLVTGSLMFLRRRGYRLLRAVQPTALLDEP